MKFITKAVNRLLDINIQWIILVDDGSGDSSAEIAKLEKTLVN